MGGANGVFSRKHENEEILAHERRWHPPPPLQVRQCRILTVKFLASNEEKVKTQKRNVTCLVFLVLSIFPLCPEQPVSLHDPHIWTWPSSN